MRGRERCQRWAEKRRGDLVNQNGGMGASSAGSELHVSATASASEGVLLQLREKPSASVARSIVRRCKGTSARAERVAPSYNAYRTGLGTVARA